MGKIIRDAIEVDPSEPFTNGTSLIDDERQRQCAKGYGRDHDDTHVDGSLARAAFELLASVVADDKTGQIFDAPDWVINEVDHHATKNRAAPIRRLVIAGALLVAEIERRQRCAIAKRKRKKPKSR